MAPHVYICHLVVLKSKVSKHIEGQFKKKQVIADLKVTEVHKYLDLVYFINYG